MFLYSGKCRLCEVGSMTSLVDSRGRELMLGDIVKVTSDRRYFIEFVSAVVANEFVSYTTGEHEKLVEPSVPFVMGLKSDFVDGTIEDLVIEKVASFSEFEHGEKFSEFGFAFRED